MTPEPLGPNTIRAMREAQKLMANRDTQARVVQARRALGNGLVESRIQQRWAEAIAPVLDQTLGSIQRALEKVDWDAVRSFIARAGEALRRQLPSNLQVLEPALWPKVTQIAREEQLCLAWVPDIDLVRELLDAADAPEREALLVANADAVLDACARALAARADGDREAASELDDKLEEVGLGRSEVPGAVELAQKSVQAAQAGFFEAAQALSTCVIDSVATQYLAAGSKGMQTTVKRTIKRGEAKQLLAVVVMDVHVAIDSSFRHSTSWDKPVEGLVGYSRHATVHAARPATFTTGTALKAVVLATSVVLVADHPLVLMLLDFINSDPEPERGGQA